MPFHWGYEKVWYMLEAEVQDYWITQKEIYVKQTIVIIIQMSPWDKILTMSIGVWLDF